MQGWLTSQNVLQAVARLISAAQVGFAPPRPAAGPGRPGRPGQPGQPDDLRRAPTPLGGYTVLEIAILAGSPAAGRKLGDITWPPGCVPVSVQDTRALRDPDPGITLAPGDHVSLLARTQQNTQPPPHHVEPRSRRGRQAASNARPAAPAPGPEDTDQRAPPPH